jgi:hypothetical protein
LLFHFYRQAYAATSDFSFYRTVFEQPAGRTLVYVILMSAHLAAVLTLATAIHSAQILGWVEENFPPMEIRDGELEVSAEQPLIRKYSGVEMITFVFDTTGAYNDPRQLSDPAVLLTREQLHVLYLGSVQTYNWRDLPFTQLRDLLQVVKIAYFPVAFLSLFMYSMIEKVILVLLLSSVGVLATATYEVRLPFVYYLTIAAYSLTPAVIIELAVSMTGMGSWVLSFICLLTAGIYTYMASQRCVAIEP